jgi:hypothetical protein
MQNFSIELLGYFIHIFVGYCIEHITQILGECWSSSGHISPGSLALVDQISKLQASSVNFINLFWENCTYNHDKNIGKELHLKSNSMKHLLCTTHGAAPELNSWKPLNPAHCRVVGDVQADKL